MGVFVLVFAHLDDGFFEGVVEDMRVSYEIDVGVYARANVGKFLGDDLLSIAELEGLEGMVCGQELDYFYFRLLESLLIRAIIVIIFLLHKYL